MNREQQILNGRCTAAEMYSNKNGAWAPSNCLQGLPQQSVIVCTSHNVSSREKPGNMFGALSILTWKIDTENLR